MRLIFKNKYLSIEQFNPVEVPDFVVLTGVNGSGKSHLVAAIEQEHVIVEGLNSPDIVHFNYQNFMLQNEPVLNSQQIASEREAAWQFHQKNVMPQAQGWRQHLGNSYEEIKTICKQVNQSFFNHAAVPVIQYAQAAKNHFKRKNWRDNATAQGVYALAKRLPYSIDEIEHDEFLSLYKPYTFTKDFLPNQLGKIFWDYYVKYYNNLVKNYENEKKGKSHHALSEEDFKDKHGPKPWDVVNEILETFDTLKYKVSTPEDSDIFGNFQLKLNHTEKESLEIDFGNLSSGERVMMALVASVYKSSSDMNFPDLLLLDEVDASLHPSMMQNMLSVINNIFLKQGVKVMLVTHSPTTIALAPDESIFVMNPSGNNRIEKKSKQDALSILTQGLATIDQGLRLFDEVAKSPITVITEGHNAPLINKALELFDVNGVEVLNGVEDITGKNQLRTIFDFFAKTQHENKVVLVWDCDVSFVLESRSNTFPYIINKNAQNTIAHKGIENAFPENLFADYKKTIIRSTGESKSEFDEARKRDFASFVVSRNNKNDFLHFSGLIQEIQRIKQL